MRGGGKELKGEVQNNFFRNFSRFSDSGRHFEQMRGFGTKIGPVVFCVITFKDSELANTEFSKFN